MIVLYILLFILILGIVVCFHEFGHYFFAKKAGILVTEFAFGMGPKLLSKKRGETYWSIRALPIGGFCAMSGEDREEAVLKVGDECKLVLDENNRVEKIILKTDSPNYADLPIIKIEKIDLFGEKMSPLYINEYEVNRDAIMVYNEKEEVQIAPEERAFFSKSVWQRFLVCVGGPFNNILLALIIFLLLAFIEGVPNVNSTIIGEVSKETPADLVGIKAGDKVLKIGDYTINNFNDIHDAIYGTYSRKLSITIERDGVEETISVYAQYYFQNMGIVSEQKTTDEGEDKLIIICESDAALGGTNKTKAYQDGGLRNGDELTYIKVNDGEYEELKSWDDFLKQAEEMDGGYVQFKYNRIVDGVQENLESGKFQVYSDELLESQGYPSVVKQLGISSTTHIEFFDCIGNGFKYLWKSATIIFSTLKLLFTSKEVGVNDMGGFITILNQTANYASGGFANLLYWVGLLSVNLGIVNLLPIPALDGGRILFLFIEGITHKKLPAKVENIIINVVFWLLLAFIGYILLQDILRLIIQLK